MRYLPHLRASGLALVSLTLFLAGPAVPFAQVIPASTEHVTRLSDIVVLGKITATDELGKEIGPMRQLYTRHTMRVEAYYKGAGPTEIDVLTAGGYWMGKLSGQDKEVKLGTQAVGSVGVRVGEEMLAFLQKQPEGYVFVEWDGAKRLVEVDPITGERSVTLRLTKKRYMHGTALEGFKNMEAMEKGGDTAAAVEAKLSRGSFLEDRVPVKDLRSRIDEIVAGEKPNKNK